jgi:hypothetical protein
MRRQTSLTLRDKWIFWSSASISRSSFHSFLWQSGLFILFSARAACVTMQVRRR